MNYLKLIIFYIGISNKLITLLVVFLFSPVKRLLMMLITPKDIEIVLKIIFTMKEIFQQGD